MKKAIPYLLLFGLLYGGWFYWQQRPRPPLRAQLLPYAAETIQRISIDPLNDDLFSLSRENDGWIVENEHRSLVAAAHKADTLLASLLRLESSGLVKDYGLEAETTLVIYLKRTHDRGHIQDERLVFYAAPDSLPTTTYYLRLNGLKDIYRVDNLPLKQLAIRFASFREKRLIDLSVLPSLDSLVWWQAADSSRHQLLVRATGDSSQLDSLQTAWSPRLENRYANFFGEIRDQPLLAGHYLLYPPAVNDSVVLSVYANDRWPKPFVLKGLNEEYFAVDNLPFALDSSLVR